MNEFELEQKIRGWLRDGEALSQVGPDEKCPFEPDRTLSIHRFYCPIRAQELFMLDEYVLLRVRDSDPKLNLPLANNEWLRNDSQIRTILEKARVR